MSRPRPGPKPQPPNDAPGGLTHNPFAALRPGGAATPAQQPAQKPEPAGSAPQVPASGTKLVVRREKRGRAGKTVTRITGLALATEGLEDLASRLKRALGCGASVEAGEVLVQGDQVERCAAWLEAEFRLRVTLGN